MHVRSCYYYYLYLYYNNVNLYYIYMVGSKQNPEISDLGFQCFWL